MDHPTSRQPKPSPSSTAAPPPSTTQPISHRFSQLHTNNKKLVSHGSSCTTTLPKSTSHHARNGAVSEKNQLVWEKDSDDSSKPSSKKHPKMQSSDADKEEMKGFQEAARGRNSRSSIPPTVNNGGGRRKSFCTSQAELADFLSRSGVKVVAADMPPLMQIHAVNCARKAHDSMEKFTSKTLAFTLKKEFDGLYGPAWHCIVGTSFGSFVTHSVGGFMYFSMDQKLYILLFKTAVHRGE
ncbi:hypothetical protein AAHA92_01887 [Salvia divinorum]|uniref:Dynein light chain n=1 Tax=Salvia divinorum TaxID=28513 RepID=A0ABD1ICW2_SALDI